MYNLKFNFSILSGYADTAKKHPASHKEQNEKTIKNVSKLQRLGMELLCTNMCLPG